MATTHIPMTQVAKSTNVHAHGYDAATQTLAVTFKSGGTYHYHGVPAHVASQIATAKSVGAFIASSVRPHYKATRVDAPRA